MTTMLLAVSWASSMKILTVKGPWAWLLVKGHKDVENRSRNTKYRGQLFIHCAASCTSDYYAEVVDYIKTNNLLGKNGKPIVLPTYEHMKEHMFGRVIGSVVLVDCTDHSDSDWYMGQKAWVVNKAKELKDYIPLKGQLGIFERDLSR